MPLKIRMLLGQSLRLMRQPRTGARFKDKAHLLHETTPSGLEEVAVLYNMQKPAQKVKENEETVECVSNKRTR